MFLQKKKKKKMYQLRGSHNIDLLWYLGGENHVIDQIKTLYVKRYFKQAARTEVFPSLSCTGMPCPL